MADQEAKHIQKKKVGESLYEKLYLQGIEALQRLAGNTWTDFNEHDPGVTILENIAYTMTELSEKTKLSIPDLLLEKEGQTLKSGDNGLFIPSEIFTTNPVTVNDLRKVVIDLVENVKNVWIELQNTSENPQYNNLKGLYKISVELYFYEDKKDHDQVLQQVRAVFNAHRNLCEDVYEILICKPYSLGLDFDISLEDNVDGEDIMAKMMYSLTDFMTPEVQFSSLAQMLATGMTTDQIFSGPHLENGFIQEMHLNEPMTNITMSEIVRLISQIEGIKSINKFELVYEGEPITDAKSPTKTGKLQEKQIRVPSGYAPILVFPTSTDKLIYRNNATLFRPNLKIVRTKFASLQAGDYKNFQLASNARNEIEIPQGTYSRIPDYYLMRKQFPAIYGVGEHRLPSGLPTARYAQVNQLKAYLLPLDQLLANFLAQLNHLYSLYDVSKDTTRSYYTEELEDMKGVIELIHHDHLENEHQILNSWKSILATTNKMFDTHGVKRLDKIADNLIARFSETFPSYTLQKINAVTHESTISYKQFEKKLLLWKRKFIHHYDTISYNRFKSYDYSVPTAYLTDYRGKNESHSNIPGLVAKICILLGIQNGSPRSLTKVIWDSGIIIYKRRAGQEIVSWKLDNILYKEEKETIEFDNTVIINDTVTDLYDGYYFIGNKNDILQEVLKYGVKESSYAIKHSTTPGRNQYYVLFTDRQRTNVAHIAASQAEAEKSRQELIRFFNNVNEKSEGIVLLEHVLLTPPYAGNYYGFSLDFSSLDPQIDSAIVNRDPKPMKKRNGDVTLLLAELLPGPSQSFLNLSIVGVSGGYKVEIQNEHLDIAALSEKTYAHYADAENLLHRLQNLKTSQGDTDAVKIAFNVSYGDSASIPEDFFSFRMSAIMSDWPVRFQNPNFRQNFDNTLYREAPVHLVTDTYWLDLMTYSEFEAKYFRWVSLQSDPDAGKALLDAAHDLVLFIRETAPKSIAHSLVHA
jgi:hypothetical protein